MLLTQHPLFIEVAYLDMNVISIISKITSVSRRTLHDGSTGRKPLSPKMQKQLRDDFKLWVDKNKIRFPALEGIGGEKPRYAGKDDFEAHPWFDYLTGKEDEFLLNNAVVSAASPLLPQASMKELRRLEDIDYEVSKHFESGDFEQARRVLLDNWDEIPLVSILPISRADILLMRTWDELLPYCNLMNMHSLLYVLALIDVAAGRAGISVMDDLLPKRVNAGWHSPIRGWLIGVQKQLGMKTVDELGLIISKWLTVKKGKEECGLRYVKRWRSGKYIPSRKHVAIICARLDRKCAWNHSRQYLRFTIALVLQRFHHDRLEKHKTPEAALERLYAGYNGWYWHHRALSGNSPCIENHARTV